MNKRLIAYIGTVMIVVSGCDNSSYDTIEPTDAVMTTIVETTTRALAETTTEMTTEEEVATVPMFPVETPMLFNIQRIDDQMAQSMMGKSFHENPHIQLEDLRWLQVGHYGFDGEQHQGSMVVNKAIAEDILAIFQELYDAQYPIELIEPIDKYEADDDRSMIANNSSAFNYRVVAGTDRLSRHAYGLAVDINPLINPWVTSSGVYPPEGRKYADRTMDQQGMIKKGDACYEAFTSRGFEWGGDWNSSKDYQHFDIKIEGINQ